MYRGGAGHPRPGRRRRVECSVFINCDSEQVNRVFFNLIKNSIESINEKSQKSDDFKGIINIELFKNNDYIKVIIIDNGIGFPDKNIEDITKPYFTTKKNGTAITATRAKCKKQAC